MIVQLEHSVGVFHSTPFPTYFLPPSTTICCDHAHQTLNMQYVVVVYA